jgi:site-specific recombinase XerD
MATTALREKMVRVLRARNYSPRTIQAYISAVARFARHFGKSPDQLGSAEVNEFQLWLREHQKISASLFNQIVSALRFLYGEVLDRWDVVKRIAFARHERRLPVVLSREETVRFLASVDVPLYRVLLTTIYSAGLRLTEALALRASDIDSSRMLIRIRQGKGKKDRYVPLCCASTGGGTTCAICCFRAKTTPRVLCTPRPSRSGSSVFPIDPDWASESPPIRCGTLTPRT